MADQWYVSRNNKKHGPFTAAKLKKLAAQGRLFPTDMLLKEGMQKWVAASSVKGLFNQPVTTTAVNDQPTQTADTVDSSLKKNPVAWVQERFRANPRKLLLAGGGAAVGLLFFVVLGCMGIVSLFSGGRSTSNSADHARASGGSSGRAWGTPVKKGMAMWSVAYSSDGKYIATSGGDHIIRIWRAETGEEYQTLRGHDNDAKSIAFTPDGNWLASVSWDDSIRIWKPNEGQSHRVMKKTFAGYTIGYSVAASPDSIHVAAGYFDLRASNPVLRIWDVRSGEKALDCVSSKRHDPQGIAFSPDGKHVASCCFVSMDNVNYNDGEVKIWDAATGNEEQTIPVNGTTPNAVVFSPDGKRVAVGCGQWDGRSSLGCEIRVYNLAATAEPQVLRGHSFPVESIAYNHDGTLLVSGAGKNTALDVPGEVKVWSMPAGKEVHSLTGHTNPVTSVVFSPDGKFIVSASGGGHGINAKTQESAGEVKLWSATTGEELGTLAVEDGSSSSPATDPPSSDSPFDHRAHTKAALKKKIIEVSYTNAVQPVTKTYEAMCKPQKFKDVIGNPDRGDTSVGKNKIWTYQCSDGDITFRVHVLGNSAIQIVKIERE